MTNDTKILIAGGHVIDPGHWNGVADVLIEGGKISAVEPNLREKFQKVKALKMIEAKGLLVCPRVRGFARSLSGTGIRT